ncbi:MAG: Gfo/Idh/MocA family oxidoreductase [Armatimonadota bacterium]|nr:Gfo/Idh/MocA family oxidoreductase [Armatimonadota bacterium]MDR7489233.1 Gfo/Idh/MocA family oxidoreductase [Armatimonadota bacterium]MDR7492084.1 Gfo/Idh/MocA family oxidoreductase [Armatimonadota bacterium]MDR7528839.1 Gfo/Idh/MocA family oxidoreductase [Armatimonadota bacterium]MDR7586300.1 Gfo/Idh/MocA family oxidoreductase [Armatimonadota bacterium]
MNALRAAVIGVGTIGRLHARVFHEHPHTRLAAVMDVREARAREVGEALGVRWYDDWEALLAEEDLDIVSVATPEQARFAPAVAAARAGRHVLLEKPLAPTLDEAQRLVREVEATGVMAMVNFVLRSDPRYVRAKLAMSDGTVGEPCTMFARRRGTRLGAEFYGPWTDLLISTAIHDIDIMIWLNEAPVERVFAEAVVKRSAEWEREDAVAGLLRFANGCVGLLETSWVLPPTVPAPLDAALHVVGTAGGIFIEGANQGMAVVTRERYSHPDLTHWPIGRTGVEGDLRASLDHFITCVRTGQPPVADLRSALYAQEVVAAMKASLRTGRPVPLPFREPHAGGGDGGVRGTVSPQTGADA